MEKFIFLDIDGVFNYLGWWETEEHYKIYGTKGELESHFDPVCINNFNYILDSVPDSKVILSSSWRLQTQSRLKPYGDYPNGIIDVMMNVGFKRIDGKIPSIHGKRDVEIIEFLKPYKEYSIAIIDDDDYYTSSKYSNILLNSWIKVDYFNKGLSREDSIKAIKLLNNG